MLTAGLLLLLTSPARAATPSALGDITLTEFQADPTIVPQYYGEWFELYNNYPGTLDMNGVTITNATGGSITISGVPFVGRDDYLVLGVSSNQTDSATNYNGNVPVDFVYPFASFNMALSADDLTISYGGTTLDEVEWTSAWGVTSDSAEAVGLNAYNLEWANDYAVNWCSSATFITGSGMHGSPGAQNEYCGTAAGVDNDGDGYSERDGDCRDDDANIYPGSLDGNDGIAQDLGGGGNANDDADCNGVRDDGILDDDGDGYSEVDGDCNDTDVNVFPGAVEVEDDLDNDCNDCIDDLDEDGDGFGWSPDYTCGTDCSPSLDTSPDPDLPPDGDPDVNPRGIEVPYNLYDEDCDGYDECDVDGDFYDDARCGQCTEGVNCDCDDANVAIHPGAVEVTDDGLDNDCNGEVDIPDRDGDTYTEADGDCMDTDEADLIEISNAVHPGAKEICGDMLDNDCDGFFDNLPSCTADETWATVRGGGLCGVAPEAGSGAVMALGALMGLAAATRRRSGGAR
jgi:hypothetical protein